MLAITGAILFGFVVGWLSRMICALTDFSDLSQACRALIFSAIFWMSAMTLGWTYLHNRGLLTSLAGLAAGAAVSTILSTALRVSHRGSIGG
jgi:hypothetical protein